VGIAITYLTMITLYYNPKSDNCQQLLNMIPTQFPELARNMRLVEYTKANKQFYQNTHGIRGVPTLVDGGTRYEGSNQVFTHLMDEYGPVYAMPRERHFDPAPEIPGMRPPHPGQPPPQSQPTFQRSDLEDRNNPHRGTPDQWGAPNNIPAAVPTQSQQRGFLGSFEQAQYVTAESQDMQTQQGSLEELAKQFNRQKHGYLNGVFSGNGVARSGDGGTPAGACRIGFQAEPEEMGDHVNITQATRDLEESRKRIMKQQQKGTVPVVHITKDKKI
jgi:hypothetical protein